MAKRLDKRSGQRPERPDRSDHRLPTGARPGRDQGWPRWGIWMVMGLIAAALFFPSFLPSDQIDEVPYDRFLDLSLIHI